ncbi:MAG: efflux RND transporter periplasmic adaptor subunit [Bacteroidales bacterium]|nr:efflux RND transporter periplasmic adaptor subunit [Candidatus Liminaster caballi]
MKKLIKIVLWCVAGLFVVYTFFFLYQKSQPEVVEYELLQPEVRDILKTSVASGRVEPRDEVNVKPQIQGIITELYVEAGDRVKVGDPLAKVSVIPDMSQLANAQSQVRTTQLTLEETEREYARIETLYQKGVASKEEYEQAQNNLHKVREQAQSAQDALDIVTDGISKRAGKINTTIVRSTITGTILDVPVKIGTSVINANSFNEGTTVAVVADMSDIIFRGNIDETEVGRLHTGMNINLTIGAIQGIRLPAVLEYISPKGTSSNGAIMFEIKAAAQIPDTITVRAGYSANAEILLAERHQVMAVPESAIEFSHDSTFVYSLTSEPGVLPQTFDRIPANVGMSDGLYIEILDGVSEGMNLRGNLKTEKD